MAITYSHMSRMMVMGLFSVFWLSFGMLQLPTLQLGLPFATESDPTGTSSPAFNAAVALYLIVWVCHFSLLLPVDKRNG